MNECATGQHDCHVHATCTDLVDGFGCRCNEGFLDRSPNLQTQPGRICEAKPTPPPPECQVQDTNSCNRQLFEVCRMIEGQPKCDCPPNYIRNVITHACTVINECLFPELVDCSVNAICTDLVDGFKCDCKQGFRDADASRPGRLCQPSECYHRQIAVCCSHRRVPIRPFTRLPSIRQVHSAG